MIINSRQYGEKQKRTIGIYPELKHSHAINKVVHIAFKTVVILYVPVFTLKFQFVGALCTQIDSCFLFPPAHLLSWPSLCDIPQAFTGGIPFNSIFGVVVIPCQLVEIIKDLGLVFLIPNESFIKSQIGSQLTNSTWEFIIFQSILPVDIW